MSLNTANNWHPPVQISSALQVQYQPQSVEFGPDFILVQLNYVMWTEMAGQTYMCIDPTWPADGQTPPSNHTMMPRSEYFLLSGFRVSSNFVYCYGLSTRVTATNEPADVLTAYFNSTAYLATPSVFLTEDGSSYLNISTGCNTYHYFAKDYLLSLTTSEKMVPFMEFSWEQRGQDRGNCRKWGAFGMSLFGKR